MRKARVVNDLETADIDSVMQIPTAGCDEVRTQRRFLIAGQHLVCIVEPARHVGFMADVIHVK